jgi:hypothetical protein
MLKAILSISKMLAHTPTMALSTVEFCARFHSRLERRVKERGFINLQQE